MTAFVNHFAFEFRTGIRNKNLRTLSTGWQWAARPILLLGAHC